MMLKYVIWGMGKLGKVLFEMLGKERVELIVDACPTRSDICGIDVVNPNDFISRYNGISPIIITPKNSESTIEQWLVRKKIRNFFFYSCNMRRLEGFLLQAPIDKLIKQYSFKDRIIVYGYNPLAFLLYDFMEQHGFCVYLYIPKGMRQQADKNLVGCFKAYQEKDDGANDFRILLADEIQEDDFAFIRGERNITENYCNLAIRKELYDNPSIRKFRNIHLNERCFIIATGPSLRMEDLDKLYLKKEICISMNGIFGAFERTRWRPDYYVVSDASAVLQWKKEILEGNTGTKFIADVAWVFNETEITGDMYKWHFQREWDDTKLPEFSDDFSKISYMGWTVTYEGALQLAVYMGFKEIYLLGVDCCQYDSPEKQHFIKEYDKEVTVNAHLQIDKNIMAYKAAKKYAEEHGIKIYNATRGGQLEVFERVDFESLFEERING